MPHRQLVQVTLALILLALGACQTEKSISSAIKDQFVASERKAVNLAATVPGAWDQVCVLGPYSYNSAARQTLGFEWDAESKSSIATNEGVSLLVFVHDKTVVAYAEHPRTHGDFSNLTGRCFLRTKAKFMQVASIRLANTH